MLCMFFGQPPWIECFHGHPTWPQILNNYKLINKSMQASASYPSCDCESKSSSFMGSCIRNSRILQKLSCICLQINTNLRLEIQITNWC